MTESELQQLKVGERVRKISVANKLKRTYQVVAVEPEHGLVHFRLADLHSKGGVRGPLVSFPPEEIERHEMTMLDQHAAARTASSQPPKKKRTP